MFWGGISGQYGKGQGLFWEKAWGSISSESYCEHVVPLIAEYVSQTGLVLMQDNASGYAAQATLAYIRERGLVPIFWPANSPDLNLIETFGIESRIISKRNTLIFIGLIPSLGQL